LKAKLKFRTAATLLCHILQKKVKNCIFLKYLLSYIISGAYRSSGRKMTQLKITIFQENQFNYIFFIRVFKIEESETANTYVGKKGILHT
jgi:hypothetical protein